MLKTIIGGISVGIANIIPGVSGGTMMVVLGIYNKVTQSISDIFTPSSKNKKDAIIFLAEVGIGAAIGLVGFAKVLTYLFNNYPTQTMFWFIGMVLFSIPIFLKSELKESKINWLGVIIGAAIIFGLAFLNPGDNVVLNPEFPNLDLLLCGRMIIIGIIGGFTMLLPGVSGSMVLLILGEYHLFKTYLANLTTFSLDVIIPLGFMGIGIIAGIVFASMITKWAMAKNRSFTASFLLGLITASSIVLIPIHANYDFITIASSAVVCGLGGAMIILIDKYS